MKYLKQQQLVSNQSIGFNGGKIELNYFLERKRIFERNC